MKTIEELRDRLAEITEEYRSIHTAAGKDDLDEAAQTRWDQLMTEETEVREQIKAREDAEARSKRIEEHRARYDFQVAPTVPTQPEDVARMSRSQARDSALKRAEKEGPRFGITADQERHLERLFRANTADTDGDLIARRLLITESDAYRSAFAKAMTSASPTWTPEEMRAIQDFRDLEARAMSGGTDAAGGYGVPVLIDPTIILTGQGSLNPFRRISRIITITGDEWKGVSSGGVSWSYDGEATEVSDDSPTLAQPSIPTHMPRGFIPYSIQIGGDYPGFADEMSGLLVAGLDELEAQAFATGSGSGAPKGIITALDADTNVEVVVTTDGALGAVDITKVWKALPDRAKLNATWVMGAGTASDVAAFGDAYGTRTVDLTGNLEKLRTRPVEVSSYFTDFSGSTGAVNLIVVGDFRKFAIVQRAGMNIEYVPHLFGTTNNRPTGERGWLAYARHGSGVTDIRAFRLLQNQ